jgi:hypothetical protein
MTETAEAPSAQETPPADETNATVANIAPPPDAEQKTIVSAARLEANRRNGRLGRGPKTRQGKARSRMNALKSGLFSKLGQPLTKAAADGLTEALFEDYQPQTHIACELVGMLARQFLRLRAIHQMERGLLQQDAGNGRPEDVKTLEFELGRIDSVGTREERAKADETARQLLLQIDEGITRFHHAGDPRLLVDWIWNALGDIDETVAQVEADETKNRELIRLETDKDRLEQLALNATYIDEVAANAKQRRDECGRAALKVTSIADVRAVLAGGKEMAGGSAVGWRRLLGEYRSSHGHIMGRIIDIEQRIEAWDLSQSAQAASHLPKLQLLSQYEITISKQIDRLIDRLESMGCIPE